MCTNKHYIYNRVTHKRILVPCGHCKSCLQEKALSRKSRIVNTYSTSTVPLFVTLTYRNDKVPYFYYSDFLHGYIEVYRDIHVRWVRPAGVPNGVPYLTERKEYDEQSLLYSDFVPKYHLNKYQGFQSLKGQSEDKIGVCWFPDIQLFFKRLRQILKRHYDFNGKFLYYVTSEYGENTCRPHWHIVLFVPQGRLKLWQSAISKAWSNDDYIRTRLDKSVQVARDVSGYVASYVNGNSYVPEFLRNYKVFKPSHSYSKDFGMALRAFQIETIIKKIERGDLSYTVQVNQFGVSTERTILTPRYVINRYFPKFKGYSRFTSDEIFTICNKPETIYRYEYFNTSVDRYRSAQLTMDDCDKIYTSLKNHRKMFYDKLWKYLDSSDYVDPYVDDAYPKDFKYSELDIDLDKQESYGYYFVRAWNTYYSNIYKSEFENYTSPLDLLYLFDNFSEYEQGHIRSPEIYLNLRSHDYKPLVITNCNCYPQNIDKTNTLTIAFDTYCKNKNIRNMSLARQNVGF